MARNGSNIYKRKDGRYEGRILMGKKPDGKNRFIYVYARTLRGVKEKMDLAKTDLKACCSIKSRTVADGIEEWLEKRRFTWKSTTYAAYRQIAGRYIVPLLGERLITELTDEILEEFAGELPKLSGKGRLSGAYRKYICSILRQMSGYMKKKYHYACIFPELPGLPEFREEREEMKLPSSQTLDRLEEYLLLHLEEDTCLGILLAKQTGIRIGELCALQWKDFDLEEGILYVNKNLQRVKTFGDEQFKTQICIQQPKTRKSARTLPVSDRMLAILKQYEGRPEQYVVSGRKNLWAESRTLQYRFAAILKRSGCPPFHFHLLRHAFASECIRRGSDMKSLSEILGHSNIQITMNLYVHSSMQQKKKIMNLMDAMPDTV